MMNNNFWCREEAVSIVALLSADSILVNSTNQREQAINARAKFTSSEGDHITLLNILRAFKTSKQNRVRITTLSLEISMFIVMTLI